MYTYNMLIDGLCKEGRLKDAQVMFQDLLIKGYNVTVWTYNIMINGLCLEGLFDEAFALPQKMEENGCIPDVVTYQTIIYTLFENDENVHAEKLLREMIARVIAGCLFGAFLKAKVVIISVYGTAWLQNKK
ncbi:hypothetical protein P8452_51021 [Trifolium repens]|nr:hypothetical protein P8452_51021 [Trifolium repens]